MTIILTLPWPVSANRYWRSRVVNGVSMTYVSSEAKAYKAEVAWLAKQAGISKPLLGRVSIDIALYPKRPQDWARRAKANPTSWDDTVSCLDLDNARKVLYDALTGVAFEDDRWVFADSGRRMVPDGDARVVVTIRPLAPAVPQGGLFDAPPAA